MTRQNPIQTVPHQEINTTSRADQQRGNTWSYVPLTDFIETDEGFVIVCDAPGVSADAFDIRLENGLLHVHAAVPARYEDGMRFLHHEYGVGDFDRTITLGRLAEKVNVDQISAEYYDGVLTIRVPRIEAAKSTRIRVQAG